MGLWVARRPPTRYVRLVEVKAMHSRSTPFAVLVLVAAALPCRPARAQHDPAITPELYEAVCDAVIGALPDPLRAFFRAQRPALLQAATSGQASSRDATAVTVSPAAKLTAADHHIWLDAAVPPDGDTRARLMAADAYRASAGSSAGRNGALPWAAEETFHKLVQAFRNEDAALVVDASGLLIHLSVDAATPAQVTAWGSAGAHRLAQATFAQEAARHTSRLTYEVRVSPDRFRVVPQVLDEVFDVLIATHRVAAVDIPPLLKQGPSNDPRGSSTTSEPVAQTDHDDAWAGLIEDRLEASAQLAARLIGTAWTEADLPQLPHGNGTVAATQPVKPPQTPTTTHTTPPISGGFVGTRNSKVFHTADCPHAKRISAANTVSFSTAEDALRAGRKPCRTCKPSGKSPRP